jgi:hypothetical protein
MRTDGPKWRAVCKERRALTLQLASHADPNGQNIWVGRERLAEALGVSIRTVSCLLADLIALKFLRNEGWHGQARKRSLDLQVILTSSTEIRAGRVQNRAEVCRMERGRVQNRAAHDLPVVDLPGDLPKERERENSTREKTARAALTHSDSEKKGKGNGSPRLNGAELIRAEMQARGIPVCQADGCCNSIRENSRGYCRKHRSLRPPCVQKKPASTAEAEEFKELTRAS